VIRTRTLLLPIAAAVALAAPAFAQQNNQAATHQELLEQVRNVRTDENELFQRRRAEYEGTAEGRGRRNGRAAAHRRDETRDPSRVSRCW